MSEIKKIGSGKRLLLVALASASVFTANAMEPEFYQSNGTNDWKIHQYHNMDINKGIGSDYELLYRSGATATPDKSYGWLLEDKTGSGVCYEAYVGPPNTAQPTGKKIYVQFWNPFTSTWIQLGGKLENKLRIYIKSVQIELKISMLNDGSGKNYFIADLMRKNLNESQCTTGQSTLSWFKNISQTITSKKY